MRKGLEIRAAVVDQAVRYPITLKHLADATAAQLVDVVQDVLEIK